MAGTSLIREPSEPPISRASTRNWLDDIGNVARKVGDIAGNIAKVLALASTIIGLGVIVLYLWIEGAPLPTINISSLGALLAVVSTIFVSLLVFSAGTGVALISPAVGRTDFVHKNREIFPEFSDNTAPPWESRRDLGAYLAAYLACSAGTLSAISWGIWSAYKLTNDHYWIFLCAIGLSLFFPSLLAKFAPWKAKDRNANKSKPFFLRVLVGFFLVQFLEMFLYMALFTVSFLIFEKFDPDASKERQFFFSFLGFLTVVQFLSVLSSKASRRLNEIIVATIGSLALILFAVIGPNRFLSAPLRAMRVGGGVPVTLLVKTMDVGSTTTKATKVSGCLVGDRKRCSDSINGKPRPK